MQVQSSLEKDQVGIQSVINLFQEMFKESKLQINNLEIELGKSVILCHLDIGDLKNYIGSQSKILKNYKCFLEQTNKINLH